MFRKDPDAVRDWNPGLVEMCASRQQDILHEVHRLLKPGARLPILPVPLTGLKMRE